MANASSQLRSALPSEPRALVAHVRKVFADEIEGHFTAEEESLMGAVRGKSSELDAVCAEVRAEHDAMRAIVEDIARPELTDAELSTRLDRLGTLLEMHVRKEERTLYEGVQSALDEHELAELGTSVVRHLEVHVRRPEG